METILNKESRAAIELMVADGIIAKDIAERYFPELKESEDERIRKELICYFEKYPSIVIGPFNTKECIAWLEKQSTPQVRTGLEWVNTIDDACDKRYSEEYAHGEYCHEQSFKWGFQEGVDWLEKQGEQKPVDVRTTGYWHIEDVEQKPTDKVEPKFHEGEWVVNTVGDTNQVVKVLDDGYTLDDNTFISNSWATEHYHLWTIQDAEDGDVLSYVTDEEDLWIMIYRSLYEPYEGHVHYHALLVNNNFSDKGTCCISIDNLKPATKEQRDLLFQKMKEAGYEWDAINLKLNRISQSMVSAEAKEAMYDKPKWNVSDFRTWQYIVSDVLTKKDGIGQYLDSGECKKIAKYMQEEWSKKLSVEQRTTELPKGQDYGIDGLYAAIDILTKTLGEVDGYQSDDGILEHKCAISAVKNLYEQEPAWSEEDKKCLKNF